MALADDHYIGIQTRMKDVYLMMLALNLAVPAVRITAKTYMLQPPCVMRMQLLYF